jgi:phosphoglycerol transferase MdoB-like AlkP superfamily enzyme
MIVPFVPWIFAYGYIAEVIRRARSEDDPELPDWENWNELLMDGLRVTGVTLIYAIPLILIFGLGWAIYMGGTFALVGFQEGTPPAWAFLAMFGSFGVFMCSLICGTLFSMGAGVFLPAATTHVVIKRSFMALFRAGEWWRIFKANIGGYVIFIILLGGMLFIWQVVYSLIAWTLILLPVAFIAAFATMPYVGTLSALVFGRVYREAEENLAIKDEQ